MRRGLAPPWEIIKEGQCAKNGKGTVYMRKQSQRQPYHQFLFRFSFLCACVDAARLCYIQINAWEPPIYQPSQCLTFVTHNIALSALFPMRPIAPVIHTPQRYCTHAMHAPKHATTPRTHADMQLHSPRDALLSFLLLVLFSPEGM